MSGRNLPAGPVRRWPGASAIPRNAAWLGWSQHSGHHHVREVRLALAGEQPGEYYSREGATAARACRSASQPWPTRWAACCAVLAPLSRCLEAHVLAVERVNGDDTTVPVLASGKTDIA